MHYNVIKSDAFIQGNYEQTRPNCLDTRQVSELIFDSDPGRRRRKKRKVFGEGKSFFCGGKEELRRKRRRMFGEVKYFVCLKENTGCPKRKVLMKKKSIF